jgi:large subunit ribosomal protein L24
MAKKSFTISWKKSTQPRKQRKYVYNAPLHIKQNLLSVHLSPTLRKKYGFRNIQLRKGDKVKVMTGQYAKKEAKVERIDLKRERVYLTGVEAVKKDGTKLATKFVASNLMITELNLEDKKRKQKLESKSVVKKESKESKETKNNKDNSENKEDNNKPAEEQEKKAEVKK